MRQAATQNGSMAPRRLRLGLPAPSAVLHYLADKLVMRAADVFSGLSSKNRRPHMEKAEPIEGEAAPGSDSEAGRLRDAVRTHDWYHSIDLGQRIVTPGQFEHRLFQEHYPLPPSLAGMRVLDVASYDGYWAFEMEKRGAAEVVALDLARFGDMDVPATVRASLPSELMEKPIGRGFEIAREALRSKVRRETVSVYDLSESCFGKFDFVFMSDLLVHLRNPLKALENVRRVVAGKAVFVESFNPLLPGTMVRYKGFRDTIWWSYSLGALQQMIEDAGFARVELRSTFKIGKRGERPWTWHAAFEGQG